MDKGKNIDGSLANARSPAVQAEYQAEVKTYAERRVKLNDTNIKRTNI